MSLTACWPAPIFDFTLSNLAYGLVICLAKSVRCDLKWFLDLVFAYTLSIVSACRCKKPSTVCFLSKFVILLADSLSESSSKRVSNFTGVDYSPLLVIINEFCKFLKVTRTSARPEPCLLLSDGLCIATDFFFFVVLASLVLRPMLVDPMMLYSGEIVISPKLRLTGRAAEGLSFEIMSEPLSSSP